MTIKSIKIQDALKMKVLPLTDKTGKKRNIDISELPRDAKDELFFCFDRDSNSVLDAAEGQKFCEELGPYLKNEKITKKACAAFLTFKGKIFRKKLANKLVEKLENKNGKFSDDERNMAMYDLYKMPAGDILPAIPVLIGLIKDEDENKEIQHGASQALSKAGSPVFPYLLKELRDEKSFGNIMILFMDMRIRKVDMRPCVPGLRKMLGPNEKDYVRLNATKILGEIGKPAARAALPELKKNLEENIQNQLGEETLRTLVKIITPQDTNFLSILMESLKYEEAGYIAHEALIKLGEKAVHPCIAASYSENYNVRWLSIKVLGDLGEKADPAVRRLKELALSEPDNDIRLQTFCYLSRIRLHDRYIALFLLEEGLRGKKNRYDEFRATIAKTLGEMGSAAAPAVNEFISIVESRGNSLRLRANIAAALEKLGPIAKDALPVLKRIAGDKSEEPDMREYAKKAIKAIKKK